MDEKLLMFVTDNELHEKVIEHLIAKKVEMSTVNLFFQPETWEILGQQIASGNYHFSYLEEGYVDKRNGAPMSYKAASGRNFEDVRKIYMMNPMDRAVAHMIYLIYYKLYIGDTHERCVSYKSRIGTSKVARQLSKEMNELNFFSGFKADIHHYFDEVNLTTIEKELKRMGTGSALDRLLWELYHDDRVMVNGTVIRKYRGLIQGCAFACLLANLVLKDIDVAISKMDVIYYRYSDDIICLGKDWRKAMFKVEEMIAPKGLELHPKKLQFIKRDEWFEFLGFKFKGNMITVSAKTLKNIEHNIKTRTMSITRQKHRGATEAEIANMIRSLQKYFFTAYAKDHENFGMGVYLFGTVNVKKDLDRIERYCKDCLRAAYTNHSNIYGLGSVNGDDYTIPFHKGKNVAENLKKTQMGDWDLVHDCGWVSLMRMYSEYKIDKDLFENSVWRMANGF